MDIKSIEQKKFFDDILGKEIELRISDYFLKFRVGNREFFWSLKDGRFDGSGAYLP